MGGTDGNGKKGPSPGSELEEESTGQVDILEAEGGVGQSRKW